jgi:ADP-dependent phosphofructokinase/glucokinase
MKYRIKEKETGKTSALMATYKTAVRAVSYLEGEDIRKDRFEPDSYIIEEVPDGENITMQRL